MRKLLLTVTAFLFFAGALLAQKSITGTVVDDKGVPVPNASVQVQGSNIGTTTRADGTFSLNLPASGRQLVISSVGFESVTVGVGSGSVINVSMKGSASELTNVVVTGYNRFKKTEYAGAGTKVTAEKINFVPNASFDQILQGKSPGLLVTVGSGQPGAAARVQIRGASSITGPNGPLFIVDGMPIEAGAFQALNPNDFESVDVLRDAVATAPYGNRGSNGVIIVTTRKGKAGKMTLSYTGQVGITSTGQQKFDMMTSPEILQFHENLGKLNGGTLPGWRYSPVNPANAALSPAAKEQNARILDSLRGIDVDWKDLFFRQGTFTSHDLSLSGGAAGTRYFLSAGHYAEDGIAARSNLKRYTLRANMESKTERVTISFNSSAGYTRRNNIESEGGIFLANPFAAAYLALPYQQAYNPNGTVATGSGRVGANALDRITSTSAFNDQVKLLGNLNVNFDITKNIYIGGFLGADYRQTLAERSIYPNTYAANTALFPTGPPSGSTVGGGSYSNGSGTFFQYVTRAVAGFRKVFADRHDVDIQFLSEYTREKQRGFTYIGYGINPKLLNTPVGITPGTAGAGGNALVPVVGGSKTGRALYGGIALLRYTFDGKYTLNGSFRRDASSQLPEANRWANFYSVGANWNILRENFTNSWRAFNDLRLRVSYGTAANADGFPFGNFGYLPLYGGGTYGGNITLVPTNAGNDQLTWEKIATLNLGLDFGILKSRVYGTLDVYNKRSTDGIVTQTLPAESGFASQAVNAATVENKGIELGITGELIRTQDVLWSIGANIAYNKNKVVSLGQVNEFEQGTEIVRVGLPLGSHYITKWAGVDAATGAPLYYTKDGKLTNVYSDDDYVAEFGTNDAPWIGGFSTSLNVKGFSLNAQFTFQEGFSRFNNQDFFQLNHAFAPQQFNMRREMLTMWDSPGDVTNIQSPKYIRDFSSKDIQDASFIRFRTLMLAYDIPANQLAPSRFLSAARIFVQGQNLATWTDWVGFDPEDDNNIASYEYPTPRTFTLGVTLTIK